MSMFVSVEKVPFLSGFYTKETKQLIKAINRCHSIRNRFLSLESCTTYHYCAVGCHST